MKAQASLINDFDDAISDINHVGSSSSLSNLDAPQDKQQPSSSHTRSQTVDMEENNEIHNQLPSVLVVDSTVNDA
ncbi:STE family kinase domain protein, partial [Trifolium medium]|nr:STE family kinase domain protein [Trifolium medium]